MPVTIFAVDGCLRIQFSPMDIDFRVIGGNDLPDVKRALGVVGGIERFLKQSHARHEAHKRRYGDGQRTDAVVIRLTAEWDGTERRHHGRRR